MAHATGFSTHTYAPLCKELSKHFRVYGIDMRSHGSAGDPSTHDYRWERFGEDVTAATRHIDGVIHGIGHSCGATALAMAEIEGAHTFKSLYLYEPIIPSPKDQSAHPSSNFLSTITLRRRTSFDSPQAAFENYSTKSPTNSFTTESLLGYIASAFKTSEDGTLLLRLPREIESEIYTHGTTHSTYQKLHELQIRIRFAMGSNSDVYPTEFIYELATLPQGASVQVVDQLDHFGPMTAPLIIASSVHEFVNDVDGIKS